MYAVLKTGGKQYKVAVNDVIIVEKLAGEAGDSIDLDEVLMLGDGEASTVGTPMVSGARVTARVLEQKRGDKIIVFKKKRRKNYRRTRGHRQDQTVLRITDIHFGRGVAAHGAQEGRRQFTQRARLGRDGVSGSRSSVARR